MDRPAFEADRFHVELRDSKNGNRRAVTDKWDRSIDHLGVAGDGNTLLATTDDIGQHSLFSIDVKTGTPRKVVGTGDVTEYSAAKDLIVYAFATLGGPPDLYVTRTNGSNTRRLTNANQDILGQRAMSEYEQFSFKGWNDETVYGYVMKPFGFTAGKKYPVAFVDSRRPAGRVRERVELSVEPAGVGGARLRRRVHRLSWLAGLRARSLRTRSAVTGAASRSKTCRRALPPRWRSTTGSTATMPAPPAPHTAAS